MTLQFVRESPDIIRLHLLQITFDKEIRKLGYIYN
jgi:hypothetical protein